MDEIERKITKIERDGRVEKEDLEEWMEIERKRRRDVKNKVKELEREARNQEIRLRTIEENLKESGKERDEKGAEEEVERKKEKNKRKKRKMESESDESPGEEWDEWKKRILVVKKGPKWEEGAKIEEWFENVHKVKVNHVMELGERLKVEFNSREHRDKIWDLEREIYREGKMSLDEWLSFEERKERDKMVRVAKKVLSACQEAGVVMDIVVENRRMIINGRTYRKRGDTQAIETTTKEASNLGVTRKIRGPSNIDQNGYRPDFATVKPTRAKLAAIDEPDTTEINRAQPVRHTSMKQYLNEKEFLDDVEKDMGTHNQQRKIELPDRMSEEHKVKRNTRVREPHRSYSRRPSSSFSSSRETHSDKDNHRRAKQSERRRRLGFPPVKQERTWTNQDKIPKINNNQTNVRNNNRDQQTHGYRQDQRVPVSNSVETRWNLPSLIPFQNNQTETNNTVNSNNQKTDKTESHANAAKVIIITDNAQRILVSSVTSQVIMQHLARKRKLYFQE
ncbi:uncharacterized protein LOC131670156 [Phymastichus coffea]|uniref:uncharacterized protein LOC131670156 n=1 Tax=Phymastichus coffea TaxID=108790 RepID=UPI00273CB64C|nr:uncharacterized protein LOC131670156 [Phymastichus coffea]